jgi:glutaredoxin-like protein NrdH
LSLGQKWPLPLKAFGDHITFCWENDIIRLDDMRDSASERSDSMKKRVKVYAISSCHHCRCAKDLLTRLGVRFDCEDLDLADKDRVASLMEEVKRLNSKCSFPTIVIGEKVIVGYRQQLIEEALDDD